VSTLKLDNLYTHSKNVGQEPLGFFCGSYIVTLNKQAMAEDEHLEVCRVVDAAIPNTITAELLPGEVICSDGIVRRGTASEVVGYDEFHTYKQPEDTRKVTIAEGREFAKAGALVTFRPDRVVGQGEFALVHGEAQ